MVQIFHAPNSPIAALLRRAATFAAAPHPVLIQGESGSGKELLAQYVHQKSQRKRLVSINCAALPRELAESTLFGHRKGAFTGAASNVSGAFRMADRGTLFLDELGELPDTIQAKVLRAVEEGEIRAVGSDEPIRIQTRIISATNRSLNDMVRMGLFRHDLLFRLDVFRLRIPPLRERRDDIPFLLDPLRPLGLQPEITSGGIDALQEYNWPGNVRELKNVLIRATHLAPHRIDRGVIHDALGGDHFVGSPYRQGLSAQAIFEANGYRSRQTWHDLGISKPTFYRWLSKGILQRPGRALA